MLVCVNWERTLGVWKTHLVSAWTGPETLVAEIELLDAERAGLLLVIVDELILLRLRHVECDVTREERRRVEESAPRTGCCLGEARLMDGSVAMC